MQEKEENCITAHQRPILGNAVPDQKKPNEEYESLQAHICQLLPGSLIISQAAGYLQPAACSSRRSFRRFLARPEKASSCLALPSLLQQLGGGSRPPPIRLQCVCSQPQQTNQQTTWTNIIFHPICSHFWKTSPDTELELDFKMVTKDEL